eukprot:TRINITY_DN74544_c0_g1_i1.p1 TRINITY_DN74544_c0_g1~~TRINITY_DN74544_c0_g1_i1.p1  ORF type:complete len:368 (-),score=49.47 TRINITY_DN74544_c0_g1_i1:199-1212(-)
MGASCGQCFPRKEERTNLVVEELVKSGNNFLLERSAAQVHMLIFAMDYKLTNNPLSCTIDAMNMCNLARQCGITDIRVLTDKAGPLVKRTAKQAIVDTLQSCGANDYFLMYYSGHGCLLSDAHGWDEEEVEDSAYCFQRADGQIDYRSCLTDDEFADLLTKNLKPGVRTLVLSDCCHSDTVCDFSKRIWHGKIGCSISGCLDHQTSGDIGNGGIFTHSMLLAIDKLSQAMVQGRLPNQYSVGLLFNATLGEKHKYFRTAQQQICIEHTSFANTDQIRFPLIPRGLYFAPLHRAGRGLAGGQDVPPQVLAQCSLSPDIGVMEDEFVETLQEALVETED